MERNIITVSHSLFIHRSPEDVWDYTQNYANRALWDKTVIRAQIVQESPARMVKLYMKGNTEMTFVYKMDQRPHKTSLATSDVHSPFIMSAGGSWTYEAIQGGTQWTQTNTAILKGGILTRLLIPLFRRLFVHQTKDAMKKACELLENGNTR